MSEEAYITKTRYCSGVQCPKMLWLKQYKPECFDDSSLNKAILEEGTKVGELARRLFGDFTLVEYGDTSKMVKETEELIAAGKSIIAEASFSYDGLFCSVDILKNLGNKNVELYEVKSSTKIRDRLYPGRRSDAPVPENEKIIHKKKGEPT